MPKASRALLRSSSPRLAAISLSVSSSASPASAASPARIWSTSSSEISPARTEMTGLSSPCLGGLLDDRLGHARVGDHVAGLVGGDGSAGGVVDDPAAGELEAEVEAGAEDADDREDQRGTRDAQPQLAAHHQVGVLLVQPVAHPAGVGEAGDRRPPGDELRGHPDLGEHPGDDQRGDHRGDDTDRQGDAEALDRAGGEDEEQSRGQQGGDVGVDDRGPRLVEPDLEGPPIPARGFSAYSSRARSKTSTLASIARPIASTKPARPGGSASTRARAASRRPGRRTT